MPAVRLSLDQCPFIFRRPNLSFGICTKVVAGYSYHSAYIIGSGILVWSDRSGRMAPNPDKPRNCTVILSLLRLKLFGFRRLVKDRARTQGSDEEAVTSKECEAGEVINWVVLWNFLVFVTDTGRAYFAKVVAVPGGPAMAKIREVSSWSGPNSD